MSSQKLSRAERRRLKREMDPVEVSHRVITNVFKELHGVLRENRVSEERAKKIIEEVSTRDWQMYRKEGSRDDYDKCNI